MLAAGTRLGSYEVLSPLGRGGMGEVYRARDARLGRNVALKVLPDAFAHDGARRARFEREASILASLNHPNIASLYGFEDTTPTPALVMELVEGPTLADRLGQGALPVDDALRIAKQICEALEYAHEHGVLHRDLKPANVKVTPEDTVKVLDFGLAKAMSGETPGADAANSPTVTGMATAAGVVLGTAAYMAPEQAKGKAVDRRADIWAFGAVLYELLSGVQAFRGESVTDVLAAVIGKDPEWSRLPSATPGRVRVLLHRCLRREVRQRLQAIGDARIALEDALSGTEVAGEPALERAPGGWRRVLPWALLGAAAVALAVVAWRTPRNTTTGASPEPVYLQIPLPMRPQIRMAGSFAVSPDGRQLAFAATGTDGIPRVWLRPLNTPDMRPLAGTESVGTLLFWSPDSRFLAFDSGGTLRRVAVSGGPAETLCPLPRVGVGGAWNRDDVIIFGQFGGPIMRVSASGGAATALTVLDAAHGDIGHTAPTFLPDGRHFLYLRDVGTGGAISEGTLDVQPADQDTNRLKLTDLGVVYVPSLDPGLGHLLFLRAGTLMAQRFDARHLQVAGEPVRLTPEPIGAFLDVGQFSVSTTGTLVYWSIANLQSQLTWFDRHGTVLRTVGESGPYLGFSLSPDGSRALLTRRAPTEQHLSLWLVDVERSTTAPFELDASTDVTDPVWSPDGSAVIFASNSRHMMDLYQRPLSGTTEAELLLKSSEWKVPWSWSRDGRYVLFSKVGAVQEDLWALPLGNRGSPIAVARAPAHQFNGAFSPDGHWVAYASDESGRLEVYVRAFAPGTSGEALAGSGHSVLVSTAGGYRPEWRHDGRVLYYVDLQGRLTAVDVVSGPPFRVGVPKALFQALPRALDLMSDNATAGLTAFVPSADGTQFLLLVPDTGDLAFRVVLNWQGALGK